jgi:hypothetical protein
MYFLPTEQIDAEIARALRTNQDNLALELLRLKCLLAELPRPSPADHPAVPERDSIWVDR